MHGPEAASIMRSDLHFGGTIIGSIIHARFFFLFFDFDFFRTTLLKGVTGNALPADMAHFIAMGANQVVTKPLTKAKLLEALKGHL